MKSNGSAGVSELDEPRSRQSALGPLRFVDVVLKSGCVGICQSFQ